MVIDYMIPWEKSNPILYPGQDILTKKLYKIFNLK